MRVIYSVDVLFFVVFVGEGERVPLLLRHLVGNLEDHFKQAYLLLLFAVKTV